jgi:NAD(P)-dependent dehydrogenase (short-subunit alcohol dehydrogenase family)
VLQRDNKKTEDPGPVTKESSPAASVIAEELFEDLPRFVMVAEDAPLSYVAPHRFPKSTIVITDDERGIAQAVKAELDGYQVPTVLLKMRETPHEEDDAYSANLADPESVRAVIERIRKNKGPIAGIIHLLPFRDDFSSADLKFSECKIQLRKDVKSLFFLAKAAGPDLLSQSKTGLAWICAPIDLDIMLPAQQSSIFPGHGGLRGMVKTLAAEWPSIICKGVGIEKNRDVAEIAGSIISEMAGGNREVELGFQGHRRLAIRPRRMEHSPIDNGVMVDQRSVIMITGGARGITAEAAHILAKHKPTLILVGRSQLPPAEEPEATAQCTSPAELKKRLIDRMRQESSGRATPSAVESAYRTLLHEQEIRGNLASLRQAGATVEYLQADVRDEEQIRKIVEGVYKTHGRLDGVIHGAGIIEDKLIEEKTPESFDRVFDTKVDSAIILSRVLRPESLKFFVLFSSVSGAFGNRGQVDYSTANAAMDCIAASLDQRWPGHVVSINWGPWDKVGMVSDLVRAQMTQRGVQLIAGAAGVHALEQEIQRGKKGEVQVVLGGGPWDVPESLPSKQLSSFPQVATAVSAPILATA